MESKTYRFISLIEKHPQLYNEKHKDFLRQDIRKTIWDSICKEMNWNDKKKTKKKWRKLRGKFVKKRRQHGNGSNSNEDESQRKLYNSLMFLNEHVNSRNARTSQGQTTSLSTTNTVISTITATQLPQYVQVSTNQIPIEHINLEYSSGVNVTEDAQCLLDISNNTNAINHHHPSPQQQQTQQIQTQPQAQHQTQHGQPQQHQSLAAQHIQQFKIEFQDQLETSLDEKISLNQVCQQEGEEAIVQQCEVENATYDAQTHTLTPTSTTLAQIPIAIHRAHTANSAPKKIYHQVINSYGVTEIPDSLKQLARYVVRGFYTTEDAPIVDMLVRKPWMKEDDICDLLNFDRKQLRSRITVLKNDKLLQSRLKMETGPDGKAVEVTYYFINYKTLVNVVKYKLDCMRKRMKTTERDAISRASFKCTNCQKTFTDLEAGELFDPTTSEFRCTYCSSLVEEDESKQNPIESNLGKFDLQMQKFFDLLKLVENIKLAPECLEPEPVDIETIRGQNKRLDNRNATSNGNEQWSGEATRNQGFPPEELRVDVIIGDANPTKAVKMKERPIWMTENTIVASENANDTSDSLQQAAQSSSQVIASRGLKDNEDIMSLLLQHERQPGKGSTNDAAVRSLAASTNNSDSSDDEQEIENAQIPDVDGDEATVFVAGKPIPIREVTPEIIAQMTPQEKEAYIQVYQESYSHMHD